MSSLMSFEIVAEFTILAGAVETQRRAISRFRGSSQTYFNLLNISCFMGGIVGLGLLVYYGFASVWHYPIVVGVIAAFASAIIFGIIYGTLAGRTTMGVGAIFMDMAMFIVWPVTAAWLYGLIQNLRFAY